MKNTLRTIIVDDEALAPLKLGDDEKIAGFVYIGTASEAPKERGRPDMGAIITRFGA